MSDKERYETVAKEFGNGAHITVPKQWEGHLFEVKHIGPYCPPLFENIEEEVEIAMNIEVNDDELEINTGLNNSEEEISGEVIKFEQSIKNDGKEVKAVVVIDTGSRFYKIEVNREAGDNGWENSQYKVFRDMNSEELTETNEIIELEGRAIWKPVGNVLSFGVKQTL